MARKIGWIVPLMLVAILLMPAPAQADGCDFCETFVSLSLAPPKGYAPIEVELFPCTKGVANPPYTVEVDWRDGTVEQSGPYQAVADINEEVFSHTYSAAGTYQPTICITDVIGYAWGGFGQTVTVMQFDPWVYDVNEDGTIDKQETLTAVADYFDGSTWIGKAQALQVVALYFNTNE